MGEIDPGLKAHVQGGLTTLSHAWSITRKDGVVLGFTDHDRDLEFDGIVFRADTGLSGLALAQSTGLSVDNSEAIGALSDLAIREDEIEQGRFDEADVRAWLVNWQDTNQRWLQFRGTIGELTRANGGFQAELRGLTEALNRPLGRVFQKPCTAVLGDASCRFDLTTPGYSVEVEVDQVTDRRILTWSSFSAFETDWFARGRVEVLDGPAAGLWGTVKHDRIIGDGRVIELWEPLRAELFQGAMLRISAGCDKRSSTCRLKFGNLSNFRGFPDLPGDDWMIAVPKSSGANTGGSLR